MKTFFRSLLPPALVLAVVGGLLYLRDPQVLPPGLALSTARAAFALAFLLGWRFRRGRSAWAAVLLATTTEVFHGVLAPWALPPATLGAVALLLPFNLAIVAWLGEHTVFSRRGLLRFLLLAVQACLVAPPVLERLQRLGGTAQGAPAWGTALAEGRWTEGAFAFAAAALLLRLARRSGPLEAGWLGALVAVGCALEVESGGVAFFATAGLILVLALVEGAFTLAFEDGLTGLPGRRALDERLRELSGPYALAMLDLDNFKRLNDRYGHDVGDQVLRLVASRLRSVGGGGLPFRYGGEEFTILFPGSPLHRAKPHLEELRQAIADHPFALRAPDRPKSRPKQATATGKRTAPKRRAKGQGGTKGPSLQVTVSIGLAERGPQARPAAEVLKAADSALYRAKRAGRNRIAATTR